MYEIGRSMEKLMKPAEYAKELGISRQAVYAKIKRGILKAKDVEGKLYIIVDNLEKQNTHKITPNISQPKAKTSPSKTTTETKDYKALLLAKDETISVLKGTVKDLKKSNKQISSTLKGEIDLLKEAFHEMRSLYVMQLEQKKPETKEVIEVEEAFTYQESNENWIGLKKFFKHHNVVKEKHKEKVIKRLSKAFKKEDERLMNVDGKIKLNADATYKDIIK